MQIVRHCLRLNLEGAHQVIEGVLKELQAGQVIKVSQMLALIDVTAARPGKTRF